MRVLYVTDFPPWQPKFGGALRDYNILRGLARLHEVSVGLVPGSAGEADYFAAAAESGFRHVQVLGTDVCSVVIERSRQQSVVGTSWLYLTGSDPRYRSSFRHLLEQSKPELVWYHSKETFRRLGSVPDVPSVIDLDNVESVRLTRKALYDAGTQRLKTQCRAFLTSMEESFVISRIKNAVIANPEELYAVEHKGNVQVLPNGFEFPDHLEPTVRTGKRLLFLGSLFYQPNYEGLVWFCRSAWPELRELCPEVTLDVVGHFEGDASELASFEGVNLHGWVENTAPFFRDCAFMVVPLRIGTGTRLKILDAWSKGLPVVTTSVGAEGLGAANQVTALISDTPSGFAQACAKLLANPELGCDLASSAFAHGKAFYDWRVIDGKVEEIASDAVR